MLSYVAAGNKYRHLHTGTFYKVIHVGYHNSGAYPNLNRKMIVVYVNDDLKADDVYFVETRFFDEFIDGRFEEVKNEDS